MVSLTGRIEMKKCVPFSARIFCCLQELPEHQQDDAGDAQVQVTGLFGKDLAGGAVHERGAEGQGVNQEIQPDIHFRASFPAVLRVRTIW